MKPLLLIALVVAGLILAGIAGYYSYLAAKRRREALAELANELGWSFDPSHNYSHEHEYAHFEIFARGESRSAYSTLSGMMEIHGVAVPAKMGSYTYQETHSTGKSQHTVSYYFSYLVVHLPWTGVPNLIIRPEGLFDRIAGMIGFDDIDFESAEFSRRFHVKSSDKKFAYDVIHPRMMEFLLAHRPPTIDIEHGRCCISDGSSLWKPEEFRALHAFAIDFFANWPDFVTKSLVQN